MPRAVNKSQVRPLASTIIFIFAKLMTSLTPFAQFFAFALLRVFGYITIVLDRFPQGLPPFIQTSRSNISFRLLVGA